MVKGEDPDQLLRNVGLRIAELRERKGWSREAFAERLGVSTRYLARLEAGGQNLTVHRLGLAPSEPRSPSRGSVRYRWNPTNPRRAPASAHISAPALTHTCSRFVCERAAISLRTRERSVRQPKPRVALPCGRT